MIGRQAAVAAMQFWLGDCPPFRPLQSSMSAANASNEIGPFGLGAGGFVGCATAAERGLSLDRKFGSVMVQVLSLLHSVMRRPSQSKPTLSWTSS